MMARLETIRFAQHRAELTGSGSVIWRPIVAATPIVLPQIVWRDHTPWREANLWARERAMSGDVDLETVQADMAAVRAYAQWLEDTETDWRHFPRRKEDRCLVKYRGALIAARDGKNEDWSIAPSTASSRMAGVVKFYRWVLEKRLLSPEAPPWTERRFQIRTYDAVGFERTIDVLSTSLSIPNRARHGDRLEDGLLPVSAGHRDAILEFAANALSEEVFQMLTTGFYTGMRIGTLADLKVQTLERAVPDPASPDLLRLAIGPGADPSVSTKFGVTGQIWITRAHLDELKRYSYSVRRLRREALASRDDKDLVFLTRFGRRYALRGADRSSAINGEMFTLRRRGLAAGLAFLRDFHFHQSRCTYATELTRLAIRVGGVINALAFVKEALLHRDEATTLRYIKFVEKTPAKEEAANQFTREFLGLLSRRQGGANA